MAALTVIKFILAVSIGYIIYMLVGRIVYDSRYENPMWDDMPVSVVAFGDNIYAIFLLMIVVIAGVIILASFREADTNRAQQF